MSTAAQQFRRDATIKAADLEHRATIRRATESYDAAFIRGQTRFQDWEAARQRCHEIKWEAVNHLDKYLLQFEEKILGRGGHVFWAENAQEARDYIVRLALSRNVKTVVKSKSMVTEEIHLSPELERHGMTVWETDLGEFIVQLRHEPPYHIVTPAMHLTRIQIRDLFLEKLGGDVRGEDPPELVAAARRALRRAFFSAEMGISGANFLVADVGMVAISTNEGNGRLCTSVPRIHVAVTGIEKMIPRLRDLGTLWPTLAGCGTAQPITTYSTLIGGPRAAGEPDGPEEFHVVLVDNRRSELLADTEQRDILHCIRCGACLNVCPVFKQIGGHTYGTTYQGPIGSVLTPHLRGREFAHLSFASSLCGACTSICPVKIDLHHHLLQNRRDAVREHVTGRAESIAFRLFRWMMARVRRYRVLAWLGRAAVRLFAALGLAGSRLAPLRSWSKYRGLPAIPRETFRELWRKQNA